MKQTTKVSTATIFIPGGSRVEVQESGAVSYTDMGSVDGDVSIALEWTDVKVQDNSAAILKNYKKDMKMTGSVTLMDLDPAGIVKVSGGVITSVATPASENTAIPDQVIAAGWTDSVKYALIAKTSSSDATELKLSAKPVFTSVKIATSTTPETLVEDDDYIVVVDPNASSGYSIVFIEAGMTEKGNGAITIDWGANTPTARTTLYCGSSTATFNAYKMRFSCNDSTGKARGLELFSVTTNSGGIAFGLKSALSDGTDTLPLSFTGEIDTTLTDGRQLFAWFTDTGVV
jgi:hypothetical protein